LINHSFIAATPQEAAMDPEEAAMNALDLPVISGSGEPDPAEEPKMSKSAMKKAARKVGLLGTAS
jgi:hypothetical protein